MDFLRRIDCRHPDWGPLLLLLLLGVGFFFPVLFLGRAPAISTLRNFEPWRTARVAQGDGTVEIAPNGGDGGAGERIYTWNTQEAFADDLNRQFIPWGLYTQERLRSGGWPLWNPHLACGQPLYANHQTGLTNPLILLSYYLFPGLSAFVAIFFSVFVLAGWGMYAYLRVLGLGRAPALLAAVTYQFMLGYIPTLDTLVVEKALLPFLLYSVERLVRAPARSADADWKVGAPAARVRRLSSRHLSNGWVWAVLATVLLALVQTSCHAQEAVFISYLLGPYILFIAGGPHAFRVPPTRESSSLWVSRTVGRRLLLALGIYLPAMLLGLIQNLPTWEFYTLSTRAAGFGEQVLAATFLEKQVTWIQSLMIAFPRLFGDYLMPKEPWLEHYLLNYGYVGIVTLLAAPFAGWIAASRRQVWFWRVVALVFFVAIISNWWYFDILCRLPFFRVSLQKPFSPLFFSLIVLGGHGYAFLLLPQPKGSRANLWLGRVSILIFGAVLSLALLLVIELLKPGKTAGDASAWVFGQLEIGAVIAALAFLVVALTWRRVNETSPAKDANGPRRPRHRVARQAITLAAAGLLFIILLDLWPAKAHFNPFVSRQNLYPPTGVGDFLVSRLAWQPGEADGPYRFGRSWKNIIPPNTGMVYDLDDFGGYDSNLVGRYTELLTVADATLLAGVHFIEAPRRRRVFSSKLWDMLGVRYVLAHPGHRDQFEPRDRWRHRYGAGGAPALRGEVLILQNLDALPRMHLVERVRQVENETNALALAVALDPAREAVIEKEGPIPFDLGSSAGNGPIGPRESPGTVVITDYRPETVTAQVSCERPALLCFFDVWFPGWEVTVDGAAAPLERVNYAFKGVFVPSGEHEVVFRYRPMTIRWGALGSLIGLILTLLLARPLARLAPPTPPTPPW